ncbi:MAG: hypothetical protein CVV51_04865 [Spirochaetae bacterium HGW-Spirochaetae-7]|nr:MAG: hypothetical protein CVV51_04865 [Spirochaetae bacterium HGW-Spirochaetae-7]
MTDTIEKMLRRHAKLQAELVAIGGALPPRPATQSGLSESVADTFGESLAYIPELKNWVVWDGSRWAVDQSGQIIQVAKLVCRACASKAESDLPSWKAWRSLEASGKLTGAVAIAATDPRFVRRLGEFDSDPWSLNTAHGLVNLKSGEIHNNEAGDFCINLAGAAPDFDTEPLAFVQFIREIADGREDLAGWIIARMAIALTGDCSLQDLEIRVGAGANGKSVLASVQSALMGDYCWTAPPELLMDSNRRGGPSPELLNLRGRRLVLVGESGEGDRLDLSLVKRLTGSDSITARALFSNVMATFEPQAKFVLSTNHAPRLARVDFAIRRRVRLVPFNRRFEGASRDPHILRKLLEERHAIMGMLVRGAQAYAASMAMPPCAEIDAASGEYLDSEDFIAQWIDACARLEQAAQTLSGDLYKSFTAWAEREGRKPWTAQAFGRALSERGIEAVKPGGQAYREGIVLR